MKRLGAMVAGAILASAGCARDPGRCCDEFTPTEDRGIYCLAHKDAVVRYVEAAKASADRLARIDWFKGVLKELELLPDSDAIHDRLSRFEKSRPDFWKEYEKHHFWSGRDTILGLEERGRLMICGFRHAVHQLETR